MRDHHQLRALAGLALAASLVCLPTMAGCAASCLDDGLAQHGCPGGITATVTVTATATETESDSASASATETADATVDDTGVGSGGGGGCPMLEEVLLPQVPTFQLVIDKSGSMDEDFGGVSRWEAVEDTLVGAGGVVTQLQSSIRFGASLYSNPMAGTCPEVQSLAPQLDARDEIATLLASEMPGGDTPTGESIEQITSELLADNWDGDKVMVLATDGEPDTCAIPEPMNLAEQDQVRGVAVDAVAAAYADGIRTFVISVGPDIAADHLQDLANAGVGAQAGDPDAPFYVADDTDSLLAAFDSIVAGLRPCEFALADPLPAALAPACSVTVNDAPFPYDDPNGWAVPDEMTLVLQGSACSAIQEGVVSIHLDCSCES